MSIFMVMGNVLVTAVRTGSAFFRMLQNAKSSQKKSNSAQSI